MSFGDRLRARREELQLSRAELADALGVSRSAIGNYETGVSSPKGEILLRLFDCLQVDPNYLYRDNYHGKAQPLSHHEQLLLDKYRSLSPVGREAVRSLVDALGAYQEELEQALPEQEARVIPLYRSPAAAGYAAPVFGEDFDYLPVNDPVPRGAEFAVRIQGDSMAPWISDGEVVYVNREVLQSGDVGIFCVDGDMLCKQYDRDPAGSVYLFSLNRQRRDADVVLTAGSGRTLVCFGRVMIRALPVPGRV